MRFKAGRPDLRSQLFWERAYVIWEFGAVKGSHVGFFVLNPDGVFYKREKEHSVASRVERLGGVISLVCLVGNRRVEFLENLDR